jgi:hypothetical protein
MIIFVVILIFLPYLIWRRTWSDILLYSFSCSLPLALRLASREVRLYFETNVQPLKLRLLARLLLPVLFFTVIWTVPALPIVATLYGIVAFAVDSAHWLANMADERNISVAAGVVATGATGGVLFYFRLKARCLYGCSEVLVGLLVAGARLNAEAVPSLNAPIFVALLTAGAYLVVRGLDNIHQGVKSESDLVVNYLVQLKDSMASCGPPASG